MSYRVVIVPALRDNYAYLLINQATHEAVVVDPSEAAPVETALLVHGVTLRAIACTHHHNDHVGGVHDLVAAHGVPVVGSRYDLDHTRILGQTVGVDAKNHLDFVGARTTIVEVPGHTHGGIAYVVDDQFLFTGDALFLGGCGRVFEGTMAEMRASMARLRELPGTLQVFAGHEYTEKNLAFARTVEPENRALAGREEAVRAVRARLASTMPGTLAEERETNPFLRWDAPEVRAFAKSDDPDEVFARVRRAKDVFV